jgi:hypothetical protein
VATPYLREVRTGDWVRGGEVSRGGSDLEKGRICAVYRHRRTFVTVEHLGQLLNFPLLTPKAPRYLPQMA